MISSQVSLFYRKVIKDFIGNLGSNEATLIELEQNNVYLNQIQEKMTSKIDNTDSLLKRLINNNNQIEKQMEERFASITSQPALTPRHPSLISEDSNIRQFNQSSSSNPENDLRAFHAARAAPQVPVPTLSTSEFNRLGCNPMSEAESNVSRKRSATGYSYDDMSEISQDYHEHLRRLREDSKIHILGTYDAYSKKHSFKMDKTEVTLENVFVKVEGLQKQILLNKLHCTSRKKVHT